MKELDKILKNPYSLVEKFSDIDDNLYDADQICEAYKAGLSADKWISVKTPPKEDAEYNVCYKMPNDKWHVFTCGYSQSFKKWDFRNKDITHWQPLPSAPKV